MKLISGFGDAGGSNFSILGNQCTPELQPQTKKSLVSIHVCACLHVCGCIFVCVSVEAQGWPQEFFWLLSTVLIEAGPLTWVQSVTIWLV